MDPWIIFSLFFHLISFFCFPRLRSLFHCFSPPLSSANLFPLSFPLSFPAPLILDLFRPPPPGLLSVPLRSPLLSLVPSVSWSPDAAPAPQLHHQLFPRPRGGLPGESERDDLRNPLPALGGPETSPAPLLPTHLRVQVSQTHSVNPTHQPLTFPVNPSLLKKKNTPTHELEQWL